MSCGFVLAVSCHAFTCEVMLGAGGFCKTP